MFHFFEYDAQIIIAFMFCVTMLIITRKLWMKP